MCNVTLSSILSTNTLRLDHLERFSGNLINIELAVNWHNYTFSGVAERVHVTMLEILHQFTYTAVQQSAIREFSMRKNTVRHTVFMLFMFVIVGFMVGLLLGRLENLFGVNPGNWRFVIGGVIIGLITPLVHTLSKRYFGQG